MVTEFPQEEASTCLAAETGMAVRTGARGLHWPATGEVHRHRPAVLPAPHPLPAVVSTAQASDPEWVRLWWIFRCPPPLPPPRAVPW